MMVRGTRNEITSVGFDPFAQSVTTDAYGGHDQLGLPVPQTPTDGSAIGRYLFVLAGARFGHNTKTRLVGIRQYVSIGTLVPDNPNAPTRYYPLEIPVTTPNWHFPDGNISWHVQRVPPIGVQTFSDQNSQGAVQSYSLTPALVFAGTDDAEAPLTYSPPVVYGTPVIPGLSNFHDIRYPWQSSSGNTFIDIEIEGPCDIILYASVWQTNPATRTTLVLPTLPAGPASLAPEDAFCVNFPAAYRRIAGSLIFENPPMIEQPAGMREIFDRTMPAAPSQIER